IYDRLSPIESPNPPSGTAPRENREKVQGTGRLVAPNAGPEKAPLRREQVPRSTPPEVLTFPGETDLSGRPLLVRLVASPEHGPSSTQGNPPEPRSCTAGELG